MNETWRGKKQSQIPLELHAVVPKRPLLHNPQFLVCCESKQKYGERSVNGNQNGLKNFPSISFTLYATYLKHYERNKKITLQKTSSTSQIPLELHVQLSQNDPYFTTHKKLWVMKAHKNMVKVSLMETKMDYTNFPIISFTLYATCLKHYESNKKNHAAENFLYIPYFQQNYYRL
jgi:hypothetical protein